MPASVAGLEHVCQRNLPCLVLAFGDGGAGFLQREVVAHRDVVVDAYLQVAEQLHAAAHVDAYLRLLALHAVLVALEVEVEVGTCRHEDAQRASQAERVLQVDRDVQPELFHFAAFSLDALLRKEQGGIQPDADDGHGDFRHRADEEARHVILVAFAPINLCHVDTALYAPLEQLCPGRQRDAHAKQGNHKRTK